MNIVITGAASGIGCRLATLLGRAGHSVIASDIDFDRLRKSATELYWSTAGVAIVQHDVTSAQAWSDLVALSLERFTSLDCLVNVAGILRVEKVYELDPRNVAQQLDVNTKGVILGTQAAAAVMVRQGQGRIINVASMAALAPVPGISVYSASKFAVRGFSLAAAQELEPCGVQVMVVCPDAVDTPMIDYQLGHAGAALTFSGSRILSVDEVARAIAALVDGKARRELVIPWSRGFVARISSCLPRGFHRWITARLTSKGLARQAELRRERRSR